MSDPVTTALGTTASTGSFLPAFANAWYAATGRQAIFCSAAVGSTSLLAAADTGSGNWSSTGTRRGGAVTAYNAARAAAAKLYSIQSARVIWCQGETDASAHNGTTITGAAYQSELEALATYFNENITGGIAEVCVIQSGADNGGSFTTGFNAIRQAQADACSNSALLRMAYDQAYTFPGLGWMEDSMHWSQEGLNAAGEIAAETIAG